MIRIALFPFQKYTFRTVIQNRFETCKHCICTWKIFSKSFDRSACSSGESSYSEYNFVQNLLSTDPVIVWWFLKHKNKFTILKMMSTLNDLFLWRAFCVSGTLESTRSSKSRRPYIVRTLRRIGIAPSIECFIASACDCRSKTVLRIAGI